MRGGGGGGEEMGYISGRKWGEELGGSVEGGRGQV